MIRGELNKENKYTVCVEGALDALKVSISMILILLSADAAQWLCPVTDTGDDT